MDFIKIILKVVIKLKRNISLSIIIMFILFIFTGCSNINKGDVTINLFDMEKAKNIAKEYLNDLIDGNNDSADKLLTSELLDGKKTLGEGVSEIISFKADSSIEGSNYGYFIFNIIRSSGVEPKSDLESMTFKVKKINNEYKIDEIKSKSQKEVYIKDKELRIIGEEGGKSELILNLSSLPKDTYLKENKIMIYKDKVPNDYFGKVCLSFTGKKIAITTSNNNDSYVCIAYIDDTLMTSTLPNSQGGNTEADVSNGNIDELEEALEKPIAKKVVSVDLLKDSLVTKFIFSEEEEILMVNYSNKYNNERVNLYKSDDGSLIETDMNENFPEDKYSIKGERFEDENLMFKVSSPNNSNDELQGDYVLNLKTLDINKL